MNKWLEILIGLILIVVAVYVFFQDTWPFGAAALTVLEGGIVWFVVLIGLLFLLLGISDLKE